MSAAEKEIKEKSSTLYIRAMGWLGLACAVLGLVFPFWQLEDLSITARFLAANGFSYLFLLPPIILVTAWYLSKPKLQVFRLMTLGSMGLFVYTLFLSHLRFDNQLIYWQQRGEEATQLIYEMGEMTLKFSPYDALGYALPLGIIGMLMIFFSPTPRLFVEKPQLLDRKSRTTRVKRADTLDELRPGGGFMGYYNAGVITLISGMILISAYVSCGLSPLKVWENRGNALEYIMGREMNADDIEYIERQRDIAPGIVAKGMAREYQDNKYRDLAWDKQPSYMEKTEEFDLKVAEFLAAMSEQEKARLSEKAYKQALEEKKGGYFPPETSLVKIMGYMSALIETIAIAVWGTLLAVVCSVPAALLTAENTLKLMISGESKTRNYIRQSIILGMRRFLDICRGFNEFVMALIFVAVLGLGPFAGVLALWIHTFGIIGKVISEQIEAINSGPIEGVSSTGATVSQVISFSVMPQIMPGFVSYCLLRFESNVRSAAVLGFVGAGGIGFLIFDKINGYNYREVCTIMIIIISAVGVIDFICKLLRRRFS